ncbi:MAG: cell division protein FtsZ [Candidatus Caldarchaeum sp.]|uniref:Cell division protein FtsZ n=1 Tax=Caldiarchaeum subterraneum TaxID=311458 RepID=A0A7C4E1L5_CALS0|nr:cell division protein FtsZ [Candidatus Caldarchaeales archaeon]MDJ0272112.1 cell division protein FtsZ [Candidatus Caldarchaeales archaeon]
MSSVEDLVQTTEEIRIKLIGVGGAGCNTVNRLNSLGLTGVYTIAANTDLQHLDMVRADKKILLGKSVTRLRGAGGDPVRGRKAAEESEEEIRRALEGADIVFLAAGLGGGTGTGAAPVVARIAREEGATVVGVVSLPFVFEGMVRKRIAQAGLEELKNYTNTSVVVDNNKLLDLYPQHNLRRAFSLADEVISNMIQSITESIAKPGLINIDYEDFKTVVSRGKLASLGIGRSSTPNRAEEATFNALQSPLLDASYEGLSGAIVHVCGGEDMQLAEAARPAEIISELMGEDGLVIWGARIDETFSSSMQVSLILTGLSSTEQIVEINEITPTSVDQRIGEENGEEIDKILEQLGIKPVSQLP